MLDMVAFDVIGRNPNSAYIKARQTNSNDESWDPYGASERSGESVRLQSRVVACHFVQIDRATFALSLYSKRFRLVFLPFKKVVYRILDPIGAQFHMLDRDP